jgi:hypothetical protein
MLGDVRYRIRPMTANGHRPKITKKMFILLTSCHLQPTRPSDGFKANIGISFDTMRG